MSLFLLLNKKNHNGNFTWCFPKLTLKANVFFIRPILNANEDKKSLKYIYIQEYLLKYIYTRQHKITFLSIWHEIKIISYFNGSKVTLIERF